MKLHWLLSSLVGVFLYCSPAYAGKLLSWDFKPRENRLMFVTDEGVQPKAKLISNPTRLVIELPGTKLGRTTVKENYRGSIRGFRIGQSTANSVSLVVELAPGYTLDPQQVKFRGISPTQWTVSLPTPKIAQAPQVITQIPASGNSSINTRPFPAARNLPPLPPRRIPPRNVTPPPRKTSSNSSVTSSPYVKPTSHGFFIDIEGDRNKRIRFSRNGSTMNFDLEDTTLPKDLASKSIAVNQYGVKEIKFSQTGRSQARISLKVQEDSPEWLATFSRIRGLILVPKKNRTNLAQRPNSSSNRRSSNRNSTRDQTIVQGLTLSNNDTEIAIRSDGSLIARTTPKGNGLYEIRIHNAKLADPFRGPRLKAGSPISQLKIRQEASSVVILVTTRLGVSLGSIDQQANNQITVPIRQLRRANILSPINVPSANRSKTKPLIIIDPGHGGQDPGTIGIGGVREKDIVLPISLDVAQELRKQGVEVRMTRDRDYFVSLQGRTDLANKIDGDLFVSIHANAINLSRPDVNGLETYYYKNGRRLAEVIHWNILNSVQIRNRNVRRARFYVLRHSEMPAVLVEVGFLTGAQDSARLKNPNHRRQIAKAIARGIIQYIKENKI